MEFVHPAPRGQGGDSTPTVSIVSAVYNVARYLPAFFESLTAQTLSHAEIEVILVDDGSTDDSLALCEAFAASWDGPARVITKTNGGQSSARNAGIEVAQGRWLNFVDPDDMLSPNFFEAMVGFAECGENREAVIHASHLVLYREETGLISDAHTMRFRFTGPDRVVDLRARPNYVQNQAAPAIFRADVIREHQLRFDERIHIRFEDGNFTARVLLTQEAPLLGLVSSAKYFYRKRADQSSAVQTAFLDRRSYTDIPRYGYLGVLEMAERLHGSTPQWAQNVVLYDIMWVFKDSQIEPLRSAQFPTDVHAEFVGLLDQVLVKLTDGAISAFDMMPVPAWVRRALILRKQGRQAYSPPIIGPVDPGRQLASLEYLYVDRPPHERFSVRGMPAEPRYVAVRQYEVLGKPYVWERKVWLSAAGDIRVWFDSVPQPILERYQEGMSYRHRRADIRELLHERRYNLVPEQFQQVDGSIRTYWKQWIRERLSSARNVLRSAFSAETYGDVAMWFAIHSTPVRRRYKDAWVLMDRDTDANDSGEIFYKWLRANKPRVKAYFVVRKGVADWHRLRREGVRPIAYGSKRWKMLMLLARHVVSAHADVYITNPLPVVRYGHPQWSFTFLQHGVIKGDISRWLNRKNIDVFVTSTEDEYNYIAGPGPFKFGTREVRLTGLPRFDDLLAKSHQIPEAERRHILIAPTWRDYLAGPILGRGNQRGLREDFMQSRYARAFQELLQSPKLAAIAEAASAKIAFMPHPNIQPYLDQFGLPAHIEILRYADVDVREVVARSRVMITDYSSIAFNMAYLHRHVVYFQFDKQEFYSGGHIERPGYFDYETHGFGPIAQTSDEVIGAVESVLDGSIDESYLSRMRATFPVRDGENCRRTYEAIVSAARRQSLAQAAVPAQPDRWEQSV